MRLFFAVFSLVVLVACGPLGPPRPDGGTGGGGGFLPFGGGTATGGGFVTTGGGGGTVTGGGSGGGATGGGSGEFDAGFDAGLPDAGSPDAGLAPLTWASMSFIDVTSSQALVGFSGEQNNLWALQGSGDLFRSTGGAFSRQLAFPAGRALYVSGSTVVVALSRSIRTCTSGCTQDSDFATTALYNTSISWDLYAEAACGEGPSHIVMLVTDVNSQGQLLEWNGSTWTRTNTNLGVRYPRACWFDAAGNLYVAGENRVVFFEGGAGTPIEYGADFKIYRGGAEVDGTQWVVGEQHFIAKGTGATIPKVNGGASSPTLQAVGGLRGDEVFALGFYTTTNAVGVGFKWDGTQFKPVGNTLPGFVAQSSVRAILPTAPNELFIAGSITTGPLVLRGRR